MSATLRWDPVDLADRVARVGLYLGQVCQIAGITKAQLDYWTMRARIRTDGKKHRIYDVDALTTVILIKQGVDKGLQLGAAIEAAREAHPARPAGNRAAEGLA